jgi:hypothetical protein
MRSGSGRRGGSRPNGVTVMDCRALFWSVFFQVDHETVERMEWEKP